MAHPLSRALGGGTPATIGLPIASEGGQPVRDLQARDGERDEERWR